MDLAHEGVEGRHIAVLGGDTAVVGDVVARVWRAAAHATSGCSAVPGAAIRGLASGLVETLWFSG